MLIPFSFHRRDIDDITLIMFSLCTMKPASSSLETVMKHLHQQDIP